MSENPADLPAATLRHELETLRALALEYHRARSTNWARLTLGTVAIALQFERSVWGLRLRVVLSPKAYTVAKRDLQAILNALGLTHYKQTALPLYGRSESLLITEEWYASRERNPAPVQPGTGAS